MSSASLVVVGAGGHAKVVVATARAAGFEIEAVLDDDRSKWGADLLGVPVSGPVDRFSSRPGVLAVGDNRNRRDLAARLDLEWATLIHPSAWVDASASLGPGTVVLAGAVIQPEARLGSQVIVNTSASIDHDCALGDFVHVGPGARLAGQVKVGTGALLGVGSSLLPGISVGAWSAVGAGAAVIRDVPPEARVGGVPARVLERDG